jgi:hypothetical protein
VLGNDDTLFDRSELEISAHAIHVKRHVFWRKPIMIMSLLGETVPGQEMVMSMPASSTSSISSIRIFAIRLSFTVVLGPEATKQATQMSPRLPPTRITISMRGLISA